MASDKDKTRGYRTRDITKPRGGKRQPRSPRLKSEASSRLASLIEKGPYADPMTRPPRPISRAEMPSLMRQREYARMPLAERFKTLERQRVKLLAELDQLERRGNQRKRALATPVILRQLDELERRASELVELMEEEKRFEVEGTSKFPPEED